MGQGTKNATTTSTQTLPSYISDAYKGLVGSAGSTAATPYTSYTGGVNGSGYSQDQQTAFGNIASMWGSSDPQFSAANDAYGRSMVPTSDTVGQYMSPYMDQVIRGAMGNMQEQNAQQQQQVVGDAITKGAMGGNRVGVAQSELARQQKLADNQAIANLYQSGYGTALGAAQADKTAALQAGQGYTGLGQTQMQAGLGQAAAQLGAGTQQQQFDYQQYLNQMAFPYQQQGWLASLVGGLGSTAGGTTTQKTPQGNIFSQLLGGALGVASMFKDGGRVRPHLAVGGVPYSNDNGEWPGVGSMFGSSPYANDNGSFGSYIPQVAMAGGRGNFPTIQEMAQQEDPLTQYSGAMKGGAANIKSWLTPQTKASDYGFGKLMHSGGVVGRQRFAAGGVPTADELAAIYGGILEPGPVGGIVGNPAMPPPAPRSVAIPYAPDGTIDTVNALDADRLGLNVKDTLTDRGEDPYLQYPEDAPVHRQPIIVPGGSAPGVVPYGEGEQFVTRPVDGGFSQNGSEALKSLFAGKGLNVAPDVRNALMTAGFGMMASRSPFALQGIGEGALAGTKAWQDYQAMERENAQARAGIGQKGEELAQQALQIGANVGNINASTAAQDTTTQINKFDYRYTPFGVQVTDKTTGQPGQIYAYGSMMPNGELAVKPDGMPVELFSTEAPTVAPDPRLMTDVGAAQAIGQATDAIKVAQSDAAGSQQTQQLLQEMKHNLAKLPSDGLMAPGTAFPERAALAKGVNTYLSVFGLEPFFPEGEVAASEDLNKLTTRLGFDLSRILGSGEAASVIMNSIAAVPGGANSKGGATKIIAGLEAANKRRIDYYNFIQKWAAGNGGSILGADEFFNRQNPPELYALSSYVPKEAMEMLRTKPGLATAFNQKYGDGKDVARFVLGR